MDMTDAIVSVLKNCLNFRGRACRSEYWYWLLATVILYVMLIFIDPAPSPYDLTEEVPEFGTLTDYLTLILLLPNLSVMARRLHDRGHSGWWQLSYLTIIGVFIVGIVAMLPSKEDENKWGRDPLLEK